METSQTKSLLQLLKPKGQHWVGDGFPVRTLFSYEAAAAISPFLLLDYAGPQHFEPSTQKRGVGEHPHRGFETVTLVYHGEVSHRDSDGGAGTIGPGDVQWMTAGAGVVHEEFHSPAFTQAGGLLEMVQLWVNLPAQHKMTAPRYQAISAASIPTLTLPNSAGSMRVIAGDYAEHHGPAQTHSPLTVCDLQLTPNKGLTLTVAEGHTAAIAVLSGTIWLASGKTINAAEVGVFGLSGNHIELTAEQAAKLLLLSGEPLNEPVVGQGPFVMNSREEIYQAMRDYRDGKLGQLGKQP